MLNMRRAAVIALIGLVLISLLDWYVDYQTGEYDQSGEAKNYYQTLFGGAVFLGLRDWAIPTWRWIDANHDALLTIFTAALFIVTALLVRYTKKLWGEAASGRESATRAADAATASAKAAQDTAVTMADTAERQLRAYIRAEAVNEEPQATPVSRIVHVQLKNSGQTPAYNVRCWAGGAVMGKNPTFEKPPADILDPPFVIHPGGIHTIGIEMEANTDANWRIKAGEVIYVWGEVRYEDAIRGKTRKTGFRLYFHAYGVFNSQKDIETMCIWRYADEGNYAD
jgi:hypothetical protein